jgi:hypothetical protein
MFLWTALSSDVLAPVLIVRNLHTLQLFVSAVFQLALIRRWCDGCHHNLSWTFSFSSFIPLQSFSWSLVLSQCFCLYLSPHVLSVFHSFPPTCPHFDSWWTVFIVCVWYYLMIWKYNMSIFNVWFVSFIAVMSTATLRGCPSGYRLSVH